MTIGAVLHLPFLDRFNLAVDYYEIEVEDAVSTINAQTTLDVCYQLLDASSEPCRAITRLPGNGQVFQVRASNSNIGSLSVKGVDLTADYTFALPDAVAFSGGADLVADAQYRLAVRTREPARRRRADRLRRILRLVHGAGRRRLAGLQGDCSRPRTTADR